MSNLQYYSSEKMTEHITLIRSMMGVFMYLIEGDEKAVLIDTGPGLGNLKGFVKTLIDKPLTVILTHGHIDHAMGAPDFDKVYMNSADKNVFIEHCSLEVRKEYFTRVLGEKYSDMFENDFVALAEPDFLNLVDDDVFDIGGINVRVFGAAGHTPGSMAVLVEEERILILGDACNLATFVFDHNSLFIEDYKKSMEGLFGKTKGLYDHIYLSHGIPEVPVALFMDVIEVCQDILDGNTDDVPFMFMGSTAYVAKATNEKFKRRDGKLGNIIYSKERVRK